MTTKSLPARLQPHLPTAAPFTPPRTSTIQPGLQISREFSTFQARFSWIFEGGTSALHHLRYPFPLGLCCSIQIPIPCFSQGRATPAPHFASSNEPSWLWLCRDGRDPPRKKANLLLLNLPAGPFWKTAAQGGSALPRIFSLPALSLFSQHHCCFQRRKTDCSCFRVDAEETDFSRGWAWHKGSK